MRFELPWTDENARSLRCRPCQLQAASAASILPVYGDRPVFDPLTNQPPFVILGPAEVRKASEFLQTTSFDELWQSAPTELARPYIGCDETEVKDMFLGHHDNLRTFYGRAAMTGHAVVKAFSF